MVFANATCLEGLSFHRLRTESSMKALILVVLVLHLLRQLLGGLDHFLRFKSKVIQIHGDFLLTLCKSCSIMK